MQKINLLFSTTKEIERKKVIKLVANVISASIVIAMISITIVVSIELSRGTFKILDVNIASITYGFSALSRLLLLIWALAIIVSLWFFIWFLLLEKNEKK